MKTKTSHRGTETQSEGSVLQIGLQYFWFESHTAAAQAFSLLSKAIHVRKHYKIRRSKEDCDYEFAPEELIGEISVKMVAPSECSQRLCASVAEKKGGRTAT